MHLMQKLMDSALHSVKCPIPFLSIASHTQSHINLKMTLENPSRNFRFHTNNTHFTAFSGVKESLMKLATHTHIHTHKHTLPVYSA